MIDIIKENLRQYAATNTLDEENAVKEILQEMRFIRSEFGEMYSETGPYETNSN